MEIFEDRLKITNPGLPLIETLRLPISLTEAPIGITTITCTGSGNSGPFTMMFGFRSSECILPGAPRQWRV